jgi:ABC-type Fe3+-hydroxamate transport system substrate-binding protein
MLYTDQIKNVIELNHSPKRIISLIPSQSEYLWDLGLKNELVGISKFCIHPKEMFETRTRVGGTKQLDIEKIKSLKPDLIIGNKEENVKEQIEELQNYFPVWMSDVNTLDEAYDMMLSLGEICDRKKESELMLTNIRIEMKEIKNLFFQKKIAYFIWNKPYMVTAKDTFIHSVLEFCGFTNVFDYSNRYPEVTIQDIRNVSPDYCFLSSEPFPFNQSHLRDLQKQLPNSKVVLVDGEMFSWYGSRLLALPNYIKKLNTEL